MTRKNDNERQYRDSLQFPASEAEDLCSFNVSSEITNSKGELCNEGEAIYFLMNEEKAKEMGFLHCEVESDGE